MLVHLCQSCIRGNKGGGALIDVQGARFDWLHEFHHETLRVVQEPEQLLVLSSGKLYQPHAMGVVDCADLMHAGRRASEPGPSSEQRWLQIVRHQSQRTMPV